MKNKFYEIFFLIYHIFKRPIIAYCLKNKLNAVTLNTFRMCLKGLGFYIFTKRKEEQA